MLTAKNLLDSLSNVKDEEIFKYENDDYDFGEVLKLYEETTYNQKIRYSNNQTDK